MVKKNLLALAVGGFGIGMTEFVIMGLLPDVSAGLGISIPETGHLITAYAMGVVVGAPILAGLSGRIPPKKTLIGLMIIFTIFNGLSALAPNYWTLMIARFLSGLPHGAFFGVGAVVASRLAERGKVAAAVAMMIGGLTVANIIGVPLGTYIGHTFGWRWTFGLVSLIGLATILSIRAWIPVLPANTQSSFLKDLRIFKDVNLWLCIALTSIGTAGFFACFSYITPLFTQVSGYSTTAIPFLMALTGVGMTVGNFLGGRLGDQIGPIRSVLILMFSMSVILILNGLLSSSPLAAAVFTFLAAAISLGMSAPVQMLLISSSRGSEMLGSALGQTSFNIGNALGAYLGGIPLVLGYSYSSPQFVGAVMAGSGGCIALALFSRIRHERHVAHEGALIH